MITCKNMRISLKLLCLSQTFQLVTGEAELPKSIGPKVIQQQLKQNIEIDRKQENQGLPSKKISPEVVKELEERFKSYPQQKYTPSKTAASLDELAWARRKISLLEQIIEQQNLCIRLLESEKLFLLSSLRHPRVLL